MIKLRIWFIKCVFSKPLTCRSALHAELEAVFFALIVIRSNRGLDVKCVQVESDSMEAIKVIRKEWECPWHCTELVESIELLSTCFEDIKFRHKCRKLNMEADILAKNAISRISPSVVWS